MRVPDQPLDRILLDVLCVLYREVVRESALPGYMTALGWDISPAQVHDSLLRLRGLIYELGMTCAQVGESDASSIWRVYPVVRLDWLSRHLETQ